MPGNILGNMCAREDQMWVWQYRNLASNNTQWTTNHQVVEVVVEKKATPGGIKRLRRWGSGGQRISELAVWDPMSRTPPVES
jgi:hypothetical protein